MTDWLRHVATRVAVAGKSGGLWWGVALSLGLAVGSVAIAAAVVMSWPADRFKEGAKEGAPASFLSTRPPALRLLARVGKNLAGLVLLILGAVMALPGVPGQGILTMIIGLTLLDFPGKLALERRLVSRPFVLRRLNGLRARLRRAPLDLG